MTPTMFRVAFAILRNRTDCEDAAQNAILKAYTKLDTLRERRYFKTWLIRILKNECASYAKAQRRTESLDLQIGLGYEMEVPDPDLNRAFDKLSADERLAITLYYYEGYSSREIAKICETTDAAIRSRLSRARETLREELSDKGGTV
jgi:RNA polymerase sigma-70 factor (ECF subfamily)